MKNGRIDASTVPRIGTYDRKGEDFEALSDYVLIKQIKHGETAGGIALPDDAKTDEELGIGEIVSIGPGSHAADGTFVPTQLKKGDVVFLAHIAQMGGCFIGGEMYLLLREGQICGKYKGGNR